MHCSVLLPLLHYSTSCIGPKAVDRLHSVSVFPWLYLSVAMIMIAVKYQTIIDHIISSTSLHGASSTSALALIVITEGVIGRVFVMEYYYYYEYSRVLWRTRTRHRPRRRILLNRRSVISAMGGIFSARGFTPVQSSTRELYCTCKQYLFPGTGLAIVFVET